MSWLTGFYNFFQDDAGIDDFVDKLNRRYVVTALGLTTVVLASSEYIGNPINCFTMSGYTSEQGNFINSVCLTQSLYYVFNENWNTSQPLLGGHTAHAHNIPVKGGLAINHYKYAPVVLILLAFFFMLPHFLWQVALNLSNGINLEAVVEAAAAMLDPISSNVTDDQAENLADRLHRFLRLEEASTFLAPSVLVDAGVDSKRRRLLGRQTTPRARRRPLDAFRSGGRLYATYMLMKIAYGVNIFCVLWAMTYFLGVDGWDYLSKIMRGLRHDPKLGTQFSGRFPTVAICEFTGEAQVMGKMLRLTNLCSIPVNIYYDKVFAFFFFIFSLLLPLVAASALLWLWRCNLSGRRFLFQYLSVNDGTGAPASSASVREFVDGVGLDLIFILRLVENNSDHVVTLSIVKKLQQRCALGRGEERRDRDV